MNLAQVRKVNCELHWRSRKSRKATPAFVEQWARRPEATEVEWKEGTVATRVSASVLVKIVRGSLRLRQEQRANAFGLHRNHVVLILQPPLDQQKLLIDDYDVILPKNLGRDDGVGDTGFIFQAEKYETFRGARTLTGDHRAGNADFYSVAQRVQIRGRENAFAFQLRAVVEAQRMGTNGHPGIA